MTVIISFHMANNAFFNEKTEQRGQETLVAMETLKSKEVFYIITYIFIALVYGQYGYYIFFKITRSTK